MTAQTPVDIGTLIYSRPDLHGGRPCIAGTGMTVQRVAILYQQGLDAEEIQAEYPHIPLSHFYAAIAYYLLDREQMDAQIEEDAAEGRRLYREWRRERGLPPNESDE
jgi:uncharacterized protein (DUF433 family)